MRLRAPLLHDVSASGLRAARSFATALLGVLSVAGASLGATPVGSEFQVNTYTTSGQAVPSISLDATATSTAAISSSRTALPRSLNGVNSPRESLDRF